MDQRTYLAIDLKSFYASVECVERSLDPLTTNLVVADLSRTEKTICLAVSPSLKAYGIPGRARLFEVVQKVKAVNAERKRANRGKPFTGSSADARVLQDSSIAVDYVVAKPQMAHYMAVSAKIYSIYLRYVAPEDIVVYSVDEVFIDATTYLPFYHLDAHTFAMKLVREVLQETGITATCGIGTNLYLAKIAMDIQAKKMKPDKDGVRIASLDEMEYRRQLWDHRPLTDFWRVGRGYANKLEGRGLYTMGDVARASLSPASETQLYKLFGINAELLIDHAWGWEPCTIADIKAYKPESNSLSIGQVLSEPYDFDKGRLIVLEMTDNLVLELVDKGLMTDQIGLMVGYDAGSLDNADSVETDWYGRAVPKAANGTQNLGSYTSSTRKIMAAMGELYDRIVKKGLLVRRMSVVANRIVPESEAEQRSAGSGEQISMFTDIDALDRQREEERNAAIEERRLQQTLLDIKKRFGKNAILKGMNFEEGATGRERNEQVGGHKV